MRLGWVRGHVTLSLAAESLRGFTLAVVEPVQMVDLFAGGIEGAGKALVAIDALGAAEGQMVGFTEGREAANPFWPGVAPVDAYCAFLVERIAVESREQCCDSEVGK